MSTAIAAAVDDVLSECTGGLLSQTLRDTVKLQNLKVLTCGDGTGLHGKITFDVAPSNLLLARRGFAPTLNERHTRA